MTPFSSNAQFTTTQEKPSTSVLENILEQENLCLTQAIQLLKTENDAILNKDTAVMGKLLDKKLPLLSKLDQLDKQRQQFFQHYADIPYSHQAFSRYIEQHPSEAIYTVWQTIKELLTECKKQNELNGRIIKIKQNNTEQILQILLGRPANNSETYSNLGQTRQQKRNALYTSV